MIGRTLGGYRIVEQVGMGGMATVYKAFDASTDRYVALKTLPEQYSKDPQFVERFRREAKAIAKLEHLHILPLFAYGEDDGVAYLAMRYLPAGTLSNYIKQQGQMPLEEASRILNQIASALDHAHANGVLHRDIKPSNVLIDKDANAYLTDFGIARMVEGTLDLTGDAILGTPQYMSPEQCQGRKDLSPASDQYSLGVVLYEMVTGRVPFQAETPLAVIIMQINGSELPLPNLLRPDLPEAAEMVLLKSLSRNPDDRYPSCEAMARAFSQAITAQASTAATRTAPPAAATQAPLLTVTKASPMEDEPTMVTQNGSVRSGPSPVLIGGIVAAVIIIGAIVLLAGRPAATEITPTPLLEQTQLALAANATVAIIPTETEAIIPTQTEAIIPTETVAVIPSATVAVVPSATVAIIPSATVAVVPSATVAIIPSATVAVVPSATFSGAVVATNDSNALPTTVAMLLAEGDTQTAINQLTGAIALTPNDANLYLLRGKAYMQEADGARALPDLTQAMTLDPTLVEAYVQRAITYRYQDDRVEAEKDLNEAIKLQPDRADVYALRGGVYRDNGEFEKSISDYDKAIDLDPNNPQWYEERATAYEWQGYLDNAVDDLNKAIALDPTSADYYARRGSDQRWREQFELGMSDFMQARALDPNNPAGFAGPVEIYLAVLDSGKDLLDYDLDMALADATQAIALNPDDSNFLVDRGRVHSYRSEYEDAVNDFSASIKIYDQATEAYLNRGNAYIHTAQFDLARADFDKALELRPDSVDAYQGRIEAFLEASDNDKPVKGYDLDAALKDANTALELQNGNAVNYLLRGKVYSRQGELDKALADLNQTVELDNSMAWGYQERGDIYGAMGKTDEAVADFNQAIALDPADAWNYAAQGDVLYDAKRPAEALTAYKMYVEMAGEGAVEYIRERVVELGKAKK